MRGETLNVYPAETALGWRVVRQIGFGDAAQKVTLGHARWIHYESGDLAGIQMLASFALDYELPAGSPTPATITVMESRMNAGEFGRSHTAGMTEPERLSRHARYDDKAILEPEDKIERAIAKVRIWPLLRNREPGLAVRVVKDAPRENAFPRLDSPCYSSN